MLRLLCNQVRALFVVRDFVVAVNFFVIYLTYRYAMICNACRAQCVSSCASCFMRVLKHRLLSAKLLPHPSHGNEIRKAAHAQLLRERSFLVSSIGEPAGGYFKRRIMNHGGRRTRQLAGSPQQARYLLDLCPPSMPGKSVRNLLCPLTANEKRHFQNGRY